MPDTIPLNNPTTISTGQADSLLITRVDALRNDSNLMTEFFNSQGSYLPFNTKLEALGFTKSIASQSPYTEHYFEKRQTHTFTVGSIITAAGGVGQEIIVALSAGDMKTINASDGLPRRYSRPRKSEKVMLPNRQIYKIVDKNTATNPHRLTLKPIFATTNANTGVLAARKVMILAPTSSEAAGQPKGLTSLFGKYQNLFTIVKESNLSSGTFKTTKSPLMQLSGQPLYWVDKDVDEAAIRHEQNISKINLFDKLGDGNTTDFSPDFDENLPDRGQEGFIAAAESTGETITYASLPSYSMDDFDKIANYYKSFMMPTKNLVALQGWNIATRIENVLVEFLADKSFQGYVSSNFMKGALKSFQDDDKTEDNMFVSIGFRGVTKNGFNFLFTTLDEFNNPEGGGATGFDYGNQQYIMPMGLTKDAKTKKSMLYIAHEYRGREEGGISRQNIFYHTGGAAITNKDQYDVDRAFWISEFCLHIANAELIVINKAA